MQVGYQVGQVVLRGSVELHQQWRDHLEVQDPWDAQNPDPNLSQTQEHIHA
jgi:hypothetical protein